MKGGKSFYYTALFAFLLLRAFAFAYFSGNYTDSDQCVMWQMAADFAHFEWHTPYFYGQLYSSGLEAWLAAPWIWLGAPVKWAVPFSTALMTTLPWIWMAQMAKKRFPESNTAAWVLLGSLIFPVSWLQSTLISRGFVQSVFLVSLATRLIFFETSKGAAAGQSLPSQPSDVPESEPPPAAAGPTLALRFQLAIILAAWGIIQNPNGVLLLPAIFPLWIEAAKKCLPALRKTSNKFSSLKLAPLKLAPLKLAPLLIIPLKLAPLLIALTALAVTYSTLPTLHPEWIVHETIKTDFAWPVFAKNIQRYNTLLQHTYQAMPFNWTLVLLLATALASLIKKNTIQWLSLVGICLLPLFLFGIEKTNDSTPNIYFGYGRFFLAIPFAWGWFWAINGLQKIDKFMPKPILFIPAITLIIAGYGYHFWDKTSIREFDKTYVPVMVYPINQLQSDADKLARICKTEKVGAVLILDHFMLETATMGMPQLAEMPKMTNGKIIPIIRPKYERRHWLLPALKKQQYIPKIVAVADVFKDSAWARKLGLPYKMADVRGPLYIFDTGNLTLDEIIQKILVF